MAKTIVLDPGHGGWDSGAVACDGKLEKAFNLELSLAVSNALTLYDCRVIMTRTTDVSCGPQEPPGADLHARAAIANQVKADLFLSIHHDSGVELARGASLYIWTQKPGWPAAVDGPVTNHTDPKTYALAQVVKPILWQTMTGLGIPWRGEITCSDFQVLRDTAMPAMLLECFFGTSPADVAIARRPSFIPTLAAGIARAVATALGLAVKAPPNPTETTIPVYVNGGDRNVGGRTLHGVTRVGITYVTIAGIEIPLREVAEALGCAVEYVTLDKGGPAVRVRGALNP